MIRILSACLLVSLPVGAYAQSFSSQAQVDACGEQLLTTSLAEVMNDGGLCGDIVGQCTTRMTIPGANVSDSCYLIVLPLLEARDLPIPMRSAISDHIDTVMGGEVGEYFYGAPLEPATAFLFETTPEDDPEGVMGQCRVSDFLVQTIQDQEPCRKLVRSCEIPEANCVLDFVWPSGSKTVVESRSTRVWDATAINGQSAGVTNAMGESDDPDCAYNFKSEKLFCFSRDGF